MGKFIDLTDKKYGLLTVIKRVENFEDAVKARKEAEEKYFGEYSYENSMKEDIQIG